MPIPRSIGVVIGALMVVDSVAFGAEDLPNEIAPLIDVTGTTAVSLGGIFSVNAHPDEDLSGLGAGLELSCVHYLGDFGSDEKHLMGVGGFLHGEVLGLGTDDIHGYAAVGGQINYLAFGLEAGGAAEFLDQAHANTLFFHVAPYVSLGILWAGFHIDIPLIGFGAGPTYGPGFGVEAGIQIPLFLGDRPVIDGARLRGPFGGG